MLYHSQIKLVIMLIEIRVWDWGLRLGDWNWRILDWGLVILGIGIGIGIGIRIRIGNWGLDIWFWD